MKKHGIFRMLWHATSVVIVLSFVGVMFSAVWEYSTRSYLKGFADAITSNGGSPERHIEEILGWMGANAAQAGADEADPDELEDRDPELTLNSDHLLTVCGTATNAFVNLARSSGLSARRLLLLDKNSHTIHVVAEVLIDSRWIVVDPSHHTIFRVPNGRSLTRQELANPAIFRAATRSIPKYTPEYTFDRTVHVHLSRIPVLGNYLREVFDFAWPTWEESLDWTLFLERESFAALTISLMSLIIGLVSRLLLGWYGSRRLGVIRPKFRDQLFCAGAILFQSSKTL
jgi:hypothetical protein